MEKKTEALSVLISNLIDKHILLPDFQRNFVWKEEDTQSRLVASVIAKMPVGSILLLRSDSKDYAYKLIGCKERKTADDLGVSGEILALLDGQQRVTVLTNAFSSVVFEMAGSANNLANQNALKRRFFFRIPRYKESVGQIEDFFQARKLSVPWIDPEKDEPSFLSDEIVDAIKVINFNATGTDCFNPFLNPPAPKGDLVNFCSSGDKGEYLIPLFLLNGNNDTWLTTILTRISENIQMDILEEFDSKSSQEERENLVKDLLTQEIIDLADHPDRICERTEFFNELKKQGFKWANDVKQYLNSCLNNIQLNQIIVDNHNRARAINIYENMNKGGVPLGTFELIMAKFASVNTENYYEKLVKNIKKNRQYPIEAFSFPLEFDEELKKWINSEEYNASLFLKCLDEDNDEINSAYIEAYLDVISLYSHNPNFDIGKNPNKKDKDFLNIDLIKRNMILAVEPKDLNDKCEDVCDALDLALFFLQMRCGVRNLKGINYYLILVVVAYILLNPKFRYDKLTYNYLDAWYWSVIFSGYFNTDQTERAIICMNKLIDALNRKDPSWIKERRKDIFNVSYFTEKDFLLLNKDGDETGIYPKEFLRDVICQFFLAETYTGLFDSNIKLNPFTEFALEKHHVVPLGSVKYKDEVISKGENDTELRKKKNFFLNSPVNFVYITDGENKIISDDKLSDYSERIKSYSARVALGLIGNFDAQTEEEFKTILSNRYDHIRGQVEAHIDKLIP